MSQVAEGRSGDFYSLKPNFPQIQGLPALWHFYRHEGVERIVAADREHHRPQILDCASAVHSSSLLFVWLLHVKNHVFVVFVVSAEPVKRVELRDVVAIYL